MVFRNPFPTLLLLITILAICESAGAALVVHSQTEVDIELIGYNGLTDKTLFKGSIAAESRREIHTQY